MFQPFYVAATGLSAFQDKLLTITDNLANASTVGFKKGNTEMESLFYVEKSFKDVLDEAMQSHGVQTTPEFGTGVRIAATPKDFTQGTIESTDSPLDLAIQGEGFLQFEMPDGSLAYGRAGNLHVDNDGNLVDPNGHIVSPRIVFPDGVTSVTISQNGTIFVGVNGSLDQEEIGQISLVRFPNREGLKSLGQNLYSETEASGGPIEGNAGDEGYGTLAQYSLEQSNVDVISEMMRMVMVQRVFDTITKAVQSYDGMLTSLERMKS
ncbi:MAG: flagellar basal-body rod protein FlgG [Candidatus Margulisiibacteriota bacterium]|nr:flagellar basal-body rod protein FlgG [Candidatus Margulisiibacteriota bacterium]